MKWENLYQFENWLFLECFNHFTNEMNGITAIKYLVTKMKPISERIFVDALKECISSDVTIKW